MADRVTILHLGEGESRQAWKEALADRPWESGTLIKKDGEREVWRANVLGSTVAVKVKPAAGARGRLRAVLGLTEFASAVSSDRLLARLGIETAPVFMRGLTGRSEVIVNAWLEGPTLLQKLSETHGDEREALLGATGHMIGVLAGNRVFNRDCKPSNIVVVSEGTASLAAIDIGGVRKPNYIQIVTLRECVRMCSCIVFEPGGVGFPLSERDIEVLVRSVCAESASQLGYLSEGHMQKRLSAKLQKRIAAHGDAKPKINPLEQPTPSRPTAPRA